MADLPSSVIGRIIAYAVEPHPVTLGSRMCAFELVSASWRSAIHAPDSEAWRLICKLEFPGSTAATRTDYHNLRHPATQSAARVIQRAIYRRFGRRNRYCLPSVACIVCGVRWGYRHEQCELSSCPFIFSRYRYSRNLESSNRFVCEPCGERYPDKAMGSFYCPCDRETLEACFKCKGTCDGYCRIRSLEYDDEDRYDEDRYLFYDYEDEDDWDWDDER